MCLLCLVGLEFGCFGDVVEVRVVARHVRSTLIEDQRHHNGLYHVCAAVCGSRRLFELETDRGERCARVER